MQTHFRDMFLYLFSTPTLYDSQTTEASNIIKRSLNANALSITSPLGLTAVDETANRSEPLCCCSSLRELFSLEEPVIEKEIERQ